MHGRGEQNGGGVDSDWCGGDGGERVKASERSDVVNGKTEGTSLEREALGTANRRPIAISH
jgi:hypothetical protein